MTMFEVLSQAFSMVCGQNPDHTWAPGGLWLPCCQRCTGLYAGAALAALLVWTFKPRPTGRFLELHGLFLLGMAPFGYHWIEHGPVIRTLTGLLFGFGLVSFLSLHFRTPEREVLTQRRGEAEAQRKKSAFFSAARRHGYWLGLVAVVGGVLLAAAMGGQAAAYSLSILCFGGAVALGFLVLANLAVWIQAGCRTLVRAVTSRRLCASASPRLCVKTSHRPL